MQYEDLIISLRSTGKDLTRLIFEDELTGLHNRRFLFHYCDHQLSAATENPRLSLLMIDLDHLKQINDTHGHAGGDLALILIAQLLKEAAGPDGLAIRYAGDEFLLVLPDARKPDALAVAHRLLQRCRAAGPRIEATQAVFDLTLSIGVASMPDDAQDVRALLDQADAALYAAKHAGRDCVQDAAAGWVDQRPERAALRNLRRVKLAGRGAQMGAITAAYDAFCQGHNQFLMIEGAAGMGKTTFLDAVRSALTLKELPVVKVSGIQQEGFRPYYLVNRILAALLQQDSERAQQVWTQLSAAEVSCLDQILLPTRRERAGELVGGSPQQREELFAVIVMFIPKLVDFRSLALLIDDLHLIDEASLLVLRRFLLRDELSLFICGTALSSVAAHEEAGQTPLERFDAFYREELGIQKIQLTPFPSEAIREHISATFPGLRLPDKLESSLTQVTQGNPLFLSELLHKLVMDQKVTLAGGHWMARPLEPGYLPQSLEDIVDEKLSLLDAESREFLGHASAIGDEVSMSMLTGSTRTVEAQAVEFVDRAVELGLIGAEFRENDEVLRFLSRAVLDVTYGRIPSAEREQLHERLGTYQETMHEQEVLPSASYLAYHFKRSCNQAKAKLYEDLIAKQNAAIFNAKEAASYSGERPGTGLPDIPLDPQSLPDVGAALRALLTAVRAIKLYPAESQAVANAKQQLMDALTRLLSQTELLKLVVDGDRLLVNGQPFEFQAQKAVREKCCELLRTLELGTLAFSRGLTSMEVEEFLRAFVQIKATDALERRFWKRFAFQHHLVHIHILQIQYVERAAGPLAPSAAPRGEVSLDEETRHLVRELVHAVLSAAKNIRLYPPQSRTVTAALARVQESLTRCLHDLPTLTLARAEGSLLVNGEKIDFREQRAAAEGVVELLCTSGLKSLTFRPPVTAEELDAFFFMLAHLPTGEVGIEFWREQARARRLTSIVFDEYDYEVLSTDPAGSGRAQGPSPAPAAREPLAPPTSEEAAPDDILEQIAARAEMLLAEGDRVRLQGMLAQLFRDYPSLDVKRREKLVDICRLVYESVPLGFKPLWSSLVADPLIVICGEEKDPQVFVVIPPTLRTMAEDLIKFAEYVLAARICSRLVALHRRLKEARDPRAPLLSDILERHVQTTTQKLLTKDLKSSDPDRQKAAAQVIGSLGPPSIYLLIEIIKTEEDLRVRELAACLLRDAGSGAGEALKRELVLEPTAQGRFRILEVIDTVTRAFDAEFAFALGDTDWQVRQAALRLAERLNDDRAGALLFQCAGGADRDLAVAAIRSLGRIQPAGASERLEAVLHATQDSEVAIACCQVLGQIGDPRGIVTLVRVAAKPPLFRLTRRWKLSVRRAAMFALKQIPPPQMGQAVSPLLKDRHRHVRKLARAFLNLGQHVSET